MLDKKNLHREAVKKKSFRIILYHDTMEKVHREEGMGRLSNDFSLYRWNFFPTRQNRYPNYMYIIFPNFLILTVRRSGGAVGRLGCRRRRRRIRRLQRDRSLLVVRPSRKLLRAAPNGKSLTDQNEAMEVWRSVRPPAGLRSRTTYDSPPPKVTAHPVLSSWKLGPSPLWTSHRRDFVRHCCHRPSTRYHFLPSLQPAFTATARSSFLATRHLPPPRCSLPLIFYLNFRFLRLHPLSTIFTTSSHNRNHNSTTLITMVVR